MKIVRTLLLSGISMFSCLLALPTQAATLTSGDLIKGPTTDAVYYYAANGKRLVFPTEQTYKTWFADFSTVKTITATELASLSLGGNVTYRPGVKLVKVTTDPKVYAVAKGGVLRWVKTETVAAALYGAAWNTRIDDVPDTYFSNYTIGAAIESASDYSPSQETANASTIDIDKGLVTSPMPTPTTTPTSTSTFTSSKSTLQPGDVFSLYGSLDDGSAIATIELLFDGQLLKRCTTFACSAETVVPRAGTKASYVAEMRIVRMDLTSITKTLTLPVQSNGADVVLITVGQIQILPGQKASVKATVDTSVAVNRINIYVDGINTKSCAGSTRICQWTDVINGAIGSLHPVYAIVTDTTGRTYTSKTTNITLSSNDMPSVTVTPAKTLIYVGESVDVVASASDSDGISWIELISNDVTLKRCLYGAPCPVSTGPWMTAGTISFTARAEDAKGLVGTSDISTIQVTVH